MGTTTETYGARVRESFAAFNGGDPTGYASHYALDARVIGPFYPEPIVGRDAIAQTAAEVSTAFPDMRWQIVTLLESGNRVALEIHIEGTHDGPLPTPAGDVPPTGRRVSFDVAAMYEFDDDGMVRELREYMDPGSLMAQLGIGAA